MPVDYETLRVVWWVLLGVLLIGYAIMDGFDLGTAVLLPFIGKTDMERQVTLTAIEPVWEGNQIWLVLGGGAIFAAWPAVYAVSFSGFYVAMFLILFALILRPVGFTFRGKIENPRWRSAWDWLLFVGGAVPALVFGVAVGNALIGAPFRFDDSLRIWYEGGFFDLLSPFALLCGAVSLAMLTMHGGAWVALKTDFTVTERAAIGARIAAVLTLVLFIAAGFWVAGSLEGYVVGDIDRAGASNPLAKEVTVAAGAWMTNFDRWPWMWLAPALGVLGTVACLLLVARRPGLAWLGSALGLTGIITTAGFAMFPFILPSALDPRSSLMVWDSSSSHLTLFVMLVATIIFMPIILAYTSYVFRVMRGKVTPAMVKHHEEGGY